jgi:hypothetical protein
MTSPQVQAKLKRATQLITELKNECTEFLNPKDFYIERVPLDSNKWDLILRMNERVPLDMGILVGDIVHNLMSSLDIALFYYLGESNPIGFSALKDWQLRKINFPIFKDESKFDESKWHGGLAEEQLLKDLYELQPFRSLEFAESEDEWPRYLATSPLWAMQELWNTDKHRGINLVIGGIDMLMLGLDRGQESVWIQRDAPPWSDGSRIYTVEVKSGSEVPILNLSDTFVIGLEGDVRPLQVYQVADKLKALYGRVEYCHWVLSRWFDYRNVENPQ